MNADIEMGVDGMQAYGRADALVTRMSKTPEFTRMFKTPGIERIQNAGGFGGLLKKDWEDLISLRNVLGPTHSSVLQHCQFNSVARRVRVKASDFGAGSKLDKRSRWVKVCLMLNQYIENLPVQEVPTMISFTGCQV